MSHQHKRILYIFLDEGGNLDFSQTGSRYFILTSHAKQRPFEAYKHLSELKYDLIETGTEIEYFHAAEDRQAVRDLVFKVIQNHLDQTSLNSLIIEKKNIPINLHAEERFYPEILGYLIAQTIHGFDLKLFEEVIEPIRKLIVRFLVRVARRRVPCRPQATRTAGCRRDRTRIVFIRVISG